MRNEFYFTLNLTENEHYIVEDMIRDFCSKNSIKVIYYRKFKNGHIPMYRECKIQGDIPKFIKYLQSERIKIDNINKKTVDIIN